MERLLEFLNFNELVHLPMVGGRFAWSRNQKSLVMSKQTWERERGVCRINIWRKFLAHALMIDTSEINWGSPYFWIHQCLDKSFGLYVLVDHWCFDLQAPLRWSPLARAAESNGESRGGDVLSAAAHWGINFWHVEHTQQQSGGVQLSP